MVQLYNKINVPPPPPPPPPPLTVPLPFATEVPLAPAAHAALIVLDHKFIFPPTSSITHHPPTHPAPPSTENPTWSQPPPPPLPQAILYALSNGNFTALNELLVTEAIPPSPFVAAENPEFEPVVPAIPEFIQEAHPPPEAHSIVALRLPLCVEPPPPPPPVFSKNVLVTPVPPAPPVPPTPPVAPFPVKLNVQLVKFTSHFTLIHKIQSVGVMVNILAALHAAQVE